MRGAYFISAMILCCGCSAVKTELYFGRSIPRGGAVSDEQWRNFSSAIARCFPKGFTELDASGHWLRSSGETDHERSKLVVAIHEDDRATRCCIDSIKERYKREFSQEAVLEVDGPVEISF